MDTIGNCQRLGVSQHMHKITILFELNWSSNLRENNVRKTTLVLQVVCNSNILVRRLLLSQKLHYFRGSRFSKCFTYYQQLSIAHYQLQVFMLTIILMKQQLQVQQLNWSL